MKKYLLITSITAFLVFVAGMYTYNVYADSIGPSGPTTTIDDSSIGTASWQSPNNSQVSDGIFASTTSLGCNDFVKDSSIKIVKGNIISGTNKATGAPWPTPETYVTYGSIVDLWGLSWTPTDINSSTFGVAIAATQQPGDAGLAISHYLKATNFGFSIPANATIIGITVEVQELRNNSGGVCP